MNHSQSENDTSPEILRYSKFQDYTNSTNISPIKLLSSSIRENYMYKESPVNKVGSRTESPIKKSNYHTEISLNRPNTSTQSPKENKLQIETDATNTVLPDTNNDVQNNDNVDVQLFKHTEMIDSPNKKPSVQRDSSNGVDTLSTNKKLQESDHSISFGSNKTDKSSDFWA